MDDKEVVVKVFCSREQTFRSTVKRILTDTVNTVTLVQIYHTQQTAEKLRPSSVVSDHNHRRIEVVTSISFLLSATLNDKS